jgi:hypothetical protein
MKKLSLSFVILLSASSLCEAGLFDALFSNEKCKGILGMSSLLAVAPSLTSKDGASNLTGTLSNSGGVASSIIGGLGKLTQQFEALGLSPI